MQLLELLLQAGMARQASAAGCCLMISGVQLDRLQPTGELKLLMFAVLIDLLACVAVVSIPLTNPVLLFQR